MPNINTTDQTERKLISIMIGLIKQKEYKKADDICKKIVDYKIEKRINSF